MAQIFAPMSSRFSIGGSLPIGRRTAREDFAGMSNNLARSIAVKLVEYSVTCPKSWAEYLSQAFIQILNPVDVQKNIRKTVLVEVKRSA